MRPVSWLWLPCAVALAFPVGASAAPWRFGAQAGLGLTNIHGDLPDLAEPKSKLGFLGGGFVEYAPGPIAVGVELMFAQKGATFEGDETDDQGNVIGTFESHLELSYLEVPVLARVALPFEGIGAPYVVVGPTFGIGLSARVEDDAPGSLDADLSDDLMTVDPGVTAGLGARFGQGPHRLRVETRFTTGFNDLWDIPGNLESINHGFGLTVGIEY